MFFCFWSYVRSRLWARAAGVLFFVLFFCFGAEAGGLPGTPVLISHPTLPSLDSFGTPKPPEPVKNTARIMPDVNYWRGGRKETPRSLTSSRALARMEETKFDGLNLMLLWPVRGRISSGFGWRGSGPQRSLHEGIDIPVPEGTPVQAALSGVVSEARVFNGYGNTVILDHGDGNGTQTLYAHCSRIAVKPGEYVEAGQVIAYAGNTGRSTTSHLHFGVIVAGVFRDPLVLLKSGPLKFVRRP
jgi:murein DD-endopeptidase MepM/ murein hydrolase activator NlpD